MWFYKRNWCWARREKSDEDSTFGSASFTQSIPCSSSSSIHLIFSAIGQKCLNVVEVPKTWIQLLQLRRGLMRRTLRILSLSLSLEVGRNFCTERDTCPCICRPTFGWGVSSSSFSSSSSSSSSSGLVADHVVRGGSLDPILGREGVDGWERTRSDRPHSQKERAIYN